jgi:hypothetical protein
MILQRASDHHLRRAEAGVGKPPFPAPVLPPEQAPLYPDGVVSCLTIGTPAHLQVRVTLPPRRSVSPITRGAGRAAIG